MSLPSTPPPPASTHPPHPSSLQHPLSNPAHAQEPDVPAHAQQQQQQQQLPFAPFFTLIAPPAPTSTHVHPRVHYIFADDATEPVAPPNSRVLVLDIAPSGTEVSSACSLSSDFQIVGTSIAPAPQWSASDGAAGLMLTIEGVEGAGLGGVKASAGVEELAATFADRMTTLRRVVGFGETARREIRREDQQGPPVDGEVSTSES